MNTVSIYQSVLIYNFLLSCNEARTIIMNRMCSLVCRGHISEQSFTEVLRQTLFYCSEQKVLNNCTNPWLLCTTQKCIFLWLTVFVTFCHCLQKQQSIPRCCSQPDKCSKPGTLSNVAPRFTGTSLMPLLTKTTEYTKMLQPPIQVHQTRNTVKHCT